MSFWAKSIGQKDAVASAFATNTNVPDAVSSAIAHLLSSPGLVEDSVIVEANGHLGGNCGSSVTIKIEAFTAAALPKLAPEPVEAAPVQVDAAAAPAPSPTP